MDMLILSLPALSQMVSYKLYLESYESYEELFNSLVALDDTETLQGLTWNSYTRIVDVIVSSAFLIALVFLLQRSRKLMRKKADEEILSMQMADMRERIGRIESLYRDMRSLKHDLKHEFRLLNELVSDGHIDDAKRGLNRLKEEMAKSVCDYSTGHPVTDVLLSDYGREAISEEIEFECEFSYSVDSGIDVFDISMILSNAISNAIKASVDADNPQIVVKGFPKQNMFLIVIKNTWRESMPTALSGYSTHYNGIHGYGIPNMRRIARKYYGDISYERKEDAIVFTAMLQMGTESRR